MSDFGCFKVGGASLTLVACKVGGACQTLVASRWVGLSCSDESLGREGYLLHVRSDGILLEMVI